MLSFCRDNLPDLNIICIHIKTALLNPSTHIFVTNENEGVLWWWRKTLICSVSYTVMWNQGLLMWSSLELGWFSSLQLLQTGFSTNNPKKKWKVGSYFVLVTVQLKQPPQAPMSARGGPCWWLCFQGCENLHLGAYKANVRQVFEGDSLAWLLVSLLASWSANLTFPQGEL